jgi:3-hydroxyisobutyrate dehydrogenase-like beta-hydroxyacid dehydrogenase
MTHERPVHVAVLGTGKMGAAIAARLAAEGYGLTLWNRSRERAEALGIGRVAATPAAAAGEARVVISSLTGPDAVRAVYLGLDGALEAGAGKLFVEMSTAGVDIVPELAAAVHAAGSRLVDAPIMGPPPTVRDGKATVLIGGAPEDAELATSIVESIGTVRHVGPLGNGARLKLIANSMFADLLLAAAELQVAGERSGLAAEDVFWVLERMAPSLAPRRGSYVSETLIPPLFAVRDLRKDLDFAVGLFEALGARTPLTSQSRDLYAAEAAAADLDVSAVIQAYRRPR